MESKLTELVSRLKEAAGKNLESVILYGSAARGDYQPGHSDLNVMCTLVTIDMNELQRLAPVVHWWTRHHHEPAPLFFLTEEMERSTDVFAVESLDAKRSHRVLYGIDVVGSLDVPMNLHRVEVERGLRELLLKLRQHVLHAGRNEMELTAVMKKTISAVKVLLRHTLLSFGEEPSVGLAQMLARVEELTGADASAFAQIYDARETGAWKEDTFGAYDRYMHALEKVIEALDTMVPKREWKRVAAQESPK